MRNKVQLVGNLGNAPEVREFTNGRKVARFSIATHDYYKNAAGERVQQTHWFVVVAWNNVAEYAERLLQQKGTQVAIEGKLITRSWTDDNGAKRSITEVLASELLLIDRIASKKAVND